MNWRAATGQWTYRRGQERLTVTWRDHEAGADLSLAAGARRASRYFETLDDLFLYHALLERALRRAGWTLATYRAARQPGAVIVSAHVFGRLRARTMPRVAPADRRARLVPFRAGVRH